MFSHIMLGASDIEASKKFYDAALGALGYGPGVMDPKGIFALSTPIDGNPATAANGGTIGFASPSVEASEAWHAAGLANGGTDCEDPPGVRDGDMGPIHLAYLRDPSGNKICTLLRV